METKSLTVRATSLGLAMVYGMLQHHGAQIEIESAAVKSAAPETHVILLTGWGQRFAADGSAPLHVDKMLSKPPKLRELREALGAWPLAKLSGSED
jgi:hypothetical protein